MAMVRALTVVMPNLIRTSEINHLRLVLVLRAQKKADDKIITKIARTRYPALSRDYSFVETPAALLPVSFSTVGMADSPSEPPPQSGLCCPGTQCYFRKNSFYPCSCKTDARSTDPAGCGDPDGQCSIDEFIDTVCDQFEIGCPEYRVG